MKFKPIRFIPDDTRFPIMRWSRFGFFISGLLSLASVLLFVFIWIRGTLPRMRVDHVMGFAWKFMLPPPPCSAITRGAGVPAR